MPHTFTLHHRRSIRLKGYDYSSQGAYFVTLCCEDRKHRFGEIIRHQMHLNDLGKIAAEWMENLPTKFPNIEIGEYVIMPDHIHAIIINDSTSERVSREADPEEIHRGEREVRAPFTGAREGGRPDAIRGDRKGRPNEGRPDEDLSDEEREVRAPFTGALERETPDAVAPEGISPSAPLGNIIGAYKSLVANGCLKWYKERNLRMGKLWQRNYYERIIRDARAYENIAAYIRNNPEKWPDEEVVRASLAGDPSPLAGALERESPDAIRGDREGRPDENPERSPLTGTPIKKK